MEQIHQREDLKDNSMKSFYQCENLFYPFREIEEYRIDDSSVTIQCNATIFTAFGYEKRTSFTYIKQELLKAWPNANISIGKYGIVVEAE